MLIKDIKAREVIDSRGNPTVEADVILENGVMGRAIVPSGASTGSNEALELRDGGTRFNGKGVLNAVSNVNTIIRKNIIGMDVNDQKAIDEALIKLDGTPNKEKLGANAILAVSTACLKAAAKLNKVPLYRYVGSGKSLPQAMMNILNGGAHADNSLDFQEYMILPKGDDFKEQVRIGCEVFHTLKKVLKDLGYNTNVGDEGGFAPDLKSNREGFEVIMEAIKKAGYTPGKDVFLGIDVAASEFYHDGLYHVDGKDMTTDELIEFYQELTSLYPIITIEDPLSEDDWDGFVKVTDKLGRRIQIVGDDLFVTNIEYLKKGIELKACNAILIKINQIGTISEAKEAVALAKKHGYNTIISHRSGETEDTTIAHLAVGLSAGQIKTGSLSRTDRICKYNELIRIEEELKSS